MLKIKDEFLSTVIAFGSNGACLGKRTQAELIDLAIMARNSNHSLLLNLFTTELPTIEILNDMKMGKIVSSTAKSTIVRSGKKSGKKDE